MLNLCHCLIFQNFLRQFCVLALGYVSLMVFNFLSVAFSHTELLRFNNYFTLQKKKITFHRSLELHWA